MRRGPFLLLLALFPANAADVYFSPEGGVRDQIIKRVNTTKQSMDIAVYSFTSGEIAEAVGRAAKRGVKVRVVRDAVQSSNKDDENAYLERAGVEVHITSGRGRGIMHDKFAVFDGAEACSGSYNWTNNAEHYNWENWFCTDEAKVITAYQKEFGRLWKAPEKPVMHRKGRTRHQRFRFPE